jgi:hypothetical protein
MATTERINQIPTTATSFASDDYLPIDGTTNGTRKILGTPIPLKDSNGNLTVNCLFEGYVNQAASGTTITLTAASAQNYAITGSGGQVIKLPDATTLPNGALFSFNNNQSSGTITVQNNSSTTVCTTQSGAYIYLVLLSNSTAAGSWDYHNVAPSNASWSTNTLSWAGAANFQTASTTAGANFATSSGSVGIGTNSPGYILDILGNTTGGVTERINNSNSAGYSQVYLTNSGTSGRDYILLTGGNTAAQTQYQNAFAIYDSSVGNARLIINPSGNVGIANTSPSYALDVTGAIRATLKGTTNQNLTPATTTISASSIDWSQGNSFYKALSANTTFTFANAVDGQVITVTLLNTTSNYTVTWPTMKWTGGTAPVMTTGAHYDVYTIYYNATVGAYFGSYVQNY